MCFGNKAARRAANAAEESAKQDAVNNQYAAQAAAQAQEAATNMDQAAKAAAELLSTPQEQAKVTLGEDTPVAEVDPTTRRRTTSRSSFQLARNATSGVNL